MPASEDSLTATLSALADPTRREILARLTGGKKTVTELAKPFDMTMPAITKHLKVLEAANLITRSRQAQYRPSELNPAPLLEIDSWLDDYRRFYQASFDRLDAYLQRLQSKETDHDG